MPSSRFVFGRITWYSVLIVTGMLLAIFLAERERKRLKLPKDTVVDLALRLIPLGVLGARLYYVIFHWDAYAADPLSALYIWQGGLAIYGGILGGALAVLLYAWRTGLSARVLADMIIPGVALAQAIGRWGNFFNMEAYGPVITDAAWQWFPAAVRIPEGGAPVWHLATFFLESVWDLLVFAALMVLRKRKRRDGDLVKWYALLYGAGRFVIEGLRTDSLMTWGGLRVSQLLSLLAMTAVVLHFAVRMQAPRLFRLLAAAAALALSGAGLGLLLRGRPAPLAEGLVSLALIALGAAAYAVKRRNDACRREE